MEYRFSTLGLSGSVTLCDRSVQWRRKYFWHGTYEQEIPVAKLQPEFKRRSGDTDSPHMQESVSGGHRQYRDNCGAVKLGQSRPTQGINANSTHVVGLSELDEKRALETAQLCAKGGVRGEISVCRGSCGGLSVEVESIVHATIRTMMDQAGRWRTLYRIDDKSSCPMKLAAL